jgi:hypothetical protein
MVLANHVQLGNDTLRDILDDSDGAPDENDQLYDLYTLGYGDETTVGDEIRRIVAAVNYNGGWLYALDIADNDTVTAAGVSGNVGAFDRLIELAKLRNSDDEFYRLRITDDGGVVYEKLDTDPLYLRFPAPRGIEFLDGTTPTWTARPGIIKYVDTAAGASLPDTWLPDRRLSFIERVAMREGDKVATFGPRDVTAEDIERAIEANMRWLESRKNKPTSAPAEKEPETYRDIYGHTHLVED